MSKKISEEDNEDYNIYETDDEENNNNYNEDEDIDDMMQVDIVKGLNKEIIEGLKFLHLKSLYNFIEVVYNSYKKFTYRNYTFYIYS